MPKTKGFHPMTKLHPTLTAYVRAARAAGFTVRAPDRFTQATLDWVFITHPKMPGCVKISRRMSPPTTLPKLTVPVVPSPEYGNAVLVDFRGGPEDLVTLLQKVLPSDTVFTQFTRNPRKVKVDRRHQLRTRLIEPPTPDDD